MRMKIATHADRGNRKNVYRPTLSPLVDCVAPARLKGRSGNFLFPLHAPGMAAQHIPNKP